MDSKELKKDICVYNGNENSSIQRSSKSKDIVYSPAEIAYQKHYDAALALLELAIGTQRERTPDELIMPNDSTTIVNKEPSIKNNLSNSIDPTQFYISDITINGYMKHINNSIKTIYIYDSYFFNTLIDRGFTKVSKWTKKERIFSKFKLFVPVFLKATQHWALIYIDLQKKEIKFYNSLIMPTSYAKNVVEYSLKEIYNYLQNKYIELYDMYLPGNWKLEYVMDCPHQENGYDCGIFICKFAEYLSKDLPLNFTQKDMPRFREEIFCTVYAEEKSVMN